MTARYLFFFTASFCLGIILYSKLKIPISTTIILSTIALISVIIKGFSKGRFFVYLFLIAISSSFGILRFYIDQKDVPNYKDEISFSGFVFDLPNERENNQRLIIKTKETKEKFLIITDLYPRFQYGEVLNISGEPEKPENFITDLGREFDYVNYLAKDDIYYVLYKPKIEKTNLFQGSFVKRALFNFKNRLEDNLKSVLHEPESSLASGLLLGSRRSLGRELTESFTKTGLIHIVVLSGYNVTIIAESILRFLSFLPQNISFSFGISSIFLFAIMTGASTTTVRASIMAILALIARKTGRSYEITRALIIAGLIMVLQNPKILVYDMSFQLSFLSTIGLIYISPYFEKRFSFITNKFGLRQIIGATLGTQIFVLPFILYKIGLLSVIAPLTNILVLPSIPITMLFSFLASIFAFLSHGLALPFSFISNILLSLQINTVEFFGDLKFSAIELNSFPLIIVIIFYVFVFRFILKNGKEA